MDRTAAYSQKIIFSWGKGMAQNIKIEKMHFLEEKNMAITCQNWNHVIFLLKFQHIYINRSMAAYFLLIRSDTPKPDFFMSVILARIFNIIWSNYLARKLFFFEVRARALIIKKRLGQDFIEFYKNIFLEHRTKNRIVTTNWRTMFFVF